MATTLGAVAEGSIVYLNESGVATPFYVAKHNYESALNGAGRTLLVRQDCYDTRTWHSSNVNAYASSDIDSWLNGTWLKLLDEFVQGDAGATKFYYTPGDGNNTVSTLSRAAFLLSVAELGLTNASANVEGTALPIAETLKIANIDGGTTDQWTRTAYTVYADSAFTVSKSGAIDWVWASFKRGSRPCITLPGETEVDASNNITNGQPDIEPTPGDYTKLEHIESTGTQFINTKYNPNGNTRVKMDVQLTSSSGDPYIFGVWTSHLVNMCSVYFAAATSTWTADYGTKRTDTGNATWNKRQIVDLNKNVLTIDETVKTLSAMSFSQTYSMYLLAHNSAGTAAVHAKAKLFSCQIYDNNTLVRDFVPARRNSDGAIGLLDQANNVFYGNAGTGTFVAGPVAEYTWLEWIESTGTQYINTNFVPNQDTRVIADYQVTNTSSDWRCIFGARNNASNANTFAFWIDGSNTFGAFYVPSGSISYFPSTIAPTDRHTIDMNKNVATLDGSKLTLTYTTIACSYPLYIFAVDNANAADYYSKTRIYSLKIYDNGTLTRDFIPAKRSDGTIGLLDIKNNVFYPNAGTGTFTAGPEIVENAGYTSSSVDGVKVSVVSGRVNVDGVEYTASHWLVNVDGIEYVIPFSKLANVCNVEVTGHTTGPASCAYVVIDGVQLDTDGSYEVETGTTITCYVDGFVVIGGKVYVDDELVANGGYGEVTYEYTVESDISVVLQRGGNDGYSIRITTL